MRIVATGGTGGGGANAGGGGGAYIGPQGVFAGKGGNGDVPGTDGVVVIDAVAHHVTGAFDAADNSHYFVCICGSEYRPDYSKSFTDLVAFSDSLTKWVSEHRNP